MILKNHIKDGILQTALDQFLKFGIREMSIKKIVEPMGISTKTVYKYFKNKEELLEEALNLHYLQQYQMLENLASAQNAVTLMLDVWHTAIGRAYNVNNLFYRDLHYYYPELEHKTETAVGRKFGLQFQNLITKGIEEGVFRADIHPGVTMEGIYVLYNAIARSELFDRYGASPREIMANTLVGYIRGFCTEKGAVYLEEHLGSLQSIGEAGPDSSGRFPDGPATFTN